MNVSAPKCLESPEPPGPNFLSTQDSLRLAGLLEECQQRTQRGDVLQAGPWEVQLVTCTVPLVGGR